MRRATQTTLACAAAIAMGSAATLAGGVLPTLVFAPMLLLGDFGPAAFLAVALLPTGMIAWHPGLLEGAKHPPFRTSVLAGLVAVGQLPWFYASWEYGVVHHGFWYCVGLLAANLLLTGLILVVEQHARRELNYPSNLLLHALLFGWMATLAFPYLGELP